MAEPHLQGRGASKIQLREQINRRDRKIAALLAQIEQYRAERGEHVRTSRRQRRGILLTYIQVLEQKVRVYNKTILKLRNALAAADAQAQHWREETRKTAAANAQLVQKARQRETLQSESDLVSSS